MTITATQNHTNIALNAVYGRHLDDAATPAAKAVEVGFTPRKARLVNLTDRIEWEWNYGQASGTTLKTAANGTRTLDTSDVAIAVASTDTGTLDTADSAVNTPVRVRASYNITFAAAVLLQNKQYHFEIYG